MTKTTVLRAAAQIAAALCRRIRPGSGPAGASATALGARHRISRREQAARAAIGMPPGHPELITRKPRRAEWRHLAAWIADLWPNDEYTAIVTEELRRDHP